MSVFRITDNKLDYEWQEIIWMNLFAKDEIKQVLQKKLHSSTQAT